MASFGTARTDSFMLGSATVMLGKPEDLFSLTESNSIGLVKGFQISSEPSYTELTQGVKNSIVYSVLTSNPVKASMEVYEYTLKNLAYSLGLEGAQVDNSTPLSDTVKTAIAAPIGQATEGAKDIELTTGAAFAAGMWVSLTVGEDTFYRQVESYTAGTKTLKVTRGFPVAVPANAKVSTIGVVGIGSKENQPTLAAKVTGSLANGDVVTLLIPKVRITKGFNLAFQTNDYGNMPFELTVLDLVNTDPFYAEFAPFGNAMLLA